MNCIKIGSCYIDKNGNPAYAGEIIYGGFDLGLEEAPKLIKKRIEEEFEDSHEIISISIVDNPKKPFVVEFKAEHIQYVVVDPERGGATYMSLEEKKRLLNK